MEYGILTTMAAGLEMMAVGLWLAWPPLALLFAGLVLCMISIAAYGKEKR